MADPVSIIVEPIVSNIIETVASLIKEELVDQGAKEEVKKLSSNLTTIQAVLEDAEQRQLDAADNRSLRDWLAKLRDAAYDAQDILESFTTETFLWKRKQQVRKTPTPFSLISKISYKSSFAYKIKEISVKFDEISKEKNNFHLNASNQGGRPHQNFSHISSIVDTADVFGREPDRDRLIDLMISNEFDTEADISIIPIIGMAGLGKTTLAQLIYNDERVKNHFESRMWVCVTKEFNLRRILKEMIEYAYHTGLTSDLPINTLISVFLDIMAGKNFLLVLDDVWIENYQEWEQLQRLLKQVGKGSRVLVTTRSTTVCDIVGTKPPYNLEYLPEDECWSLFKKIVCKDGNSLDGTSPKELEEIGWKIVEKCQGLPLAVKAIGGLLRGKVDVNKWNQILGDSILELDKEGKSNRPEILPALRLSYYHLPSCLKQCYAFCSVFPKAFDFDRKELVKLWMAEGFIQPRGKDGAEETGIEYFNELLMRSFFQILNVDNKVRYRMHDLIHDLAVSVSSPLSCQVKDNESFIFSGNARHISILGQDVETPTLQIIEKSNKLRTFLLLGESSRSLGHMLDKMFHSLNYIRVLDLSSSLLSELPSSIEKLKLLRYLDLSRTEIKVLPNSICNLCNLQILKLLGCLWLFKLPKRLGNMVNLRYLELDEMFWFKCRMLPPRMGNLTSLQNLHAFPVSGTSGHGIEELKDMANLTGTLHISKLENAVNVADAKLKEKETLQKLVLEWSDKDFKQQDEDRATRNLEDLQPHSNLQELALHHFKGSYFPLWMTNGVLQNLVTLSLIHCTKCTTICVGQLACLRKLCIKGMLELEEWPEDECLPLGRLQISNCPKLRRVPNWMPNLRVLKIKKCDSLKALPTAPSLMFLTLVDNLVLENWQEGMCIIAQDHHGNQVGQPKSTLIDLLELKIENCPNIEALPQICAPQKLEITRCGRITALPAPEFSRRLQHLALDKCYDGTLVRAIPNTNSLYSLVISNISNLNSFPKLPHLQGLKSLYISDCKDLTSLSEEEGSLKSLSSLQLLSVRGCSMLESFPDEGLPAGLECLIIGSCPILKSLGSKDTLNSLLSLKDLYLEDCPLIQSFPEGGLPSSLIHLEIHGCPQLIEECQKDLRVTEWPKIMHVTDRVIDSIKLPSAPELPKKKRLTPLIGCNKEKGGLEYYALDRHIKGKTPLESMHKFPKLDSTEEDSIEDDGEIIPSESEALLDILDEKQVNQHGETSCNNSSWFPCIFRTPFPGLKSQEPLLVSIGPYYRGKNLPLDKYKYSSLEKFLSRTRNQDKDLYFFVRMMVKLEQHARRCYSENMSIASPGFVEMMLVDACFIMEVLRHFGRNEESEDGFLLFSALKPWQIPILVQDMLMLENQIPFFILQNLFDLTEGDEAVAKVSVPLTTMALEFFNLAFPRSVDFTSKFNHLEAPRHLLDLFLKTICPSKASTTSLSNRFLKTFHLKAGDLFNSVAYLFLNALKLGNSGIEFRSRRANGFTDMHFNLKEGVLEIPPVTINDLFIAILVNSMAFEHCSNGSGCSKDVTAYVCFMSGLIRYSADVECLSSKGIISPFSYQNEEVAQFFATSENSFVLYHHPLLCLQPDDQFGKTTWCIYAAMLSRQSSRLHCLPDEA
ncbi:Disease resistance protein [Corchorus capsularis]|uniref:Disease resistance protein n=1 Tax=Corchorus capsularis TaxID=210143 RepID=A0A1R3K8E5_COCAP|nr:Disease resistance protein [Corchorus capsularis]